MVKHQRNNPNIKNAVESNNFLISKVLQLLKVRIGPVILWLSQFQTFYVIRNLDFK